MSYRFEIEVGKSKRFPVGGKYCDGDIIVTAVGGSDAPDEPVAPEYSVGLLIEWDDWNCSYSVNGRGSCTDSVVRIPESYDDGVNGESFVTEFGRVETGGEYVYPFYQDELLEEIYLPSGMASPFNSFSLQECPNLKKVYGVQNISSIELRNLPSLEYVEFVQYSEMALEIGGAIGSGTGVVYDFTKCTSVPYFDSYGFGSEFGTDPVILVPAELYDEWKSATNWTLYADYIVSEGYETWEFELEDGSIVTKEVYVRG